MKKRLFVLVLLCIAFLHPKVYAQIVNFNMGEETIEFPVSEVDSITFEADENDSFVQVLWHKGRPYYYTINDDVFFGF